MALTMDQLKMLVEEEGLVYFLDPNRDALMLRAKGSFGSYQLVILLEVEGTFLQFRSLGYHSCPEDHEHVDAVLKVLGALNYRLRFLKFGWDPEDGEITVYGDAWLEDGNLTQGQFSRMVHAYLSMMDLNNVRIGETIKTGSDPGEINPEAPPGGATGLPPEMQGLLDRLLSQLGKDDDEEEDEGGEMDTI
jgi:hypothetical protein